MRRVRLLFRKWALHALRALRVFFCLAFAVYGIIAWLAERQHAGVAQLVAQLICNQWVAGSIPVAGTIKTPGQMIVFIWPFLFGILVCDQSWSPNGHIGWPAAASARQMQPSALFGAWSASSPAMNRRLALDDCPVAKKRASKRSPPIYSSTFWITTTKLASSSKSLRTACVPPLGQ